MFTPMVTVCKQLLYMTKSSLNTKRGEEFMKRTTTTLIILILIFVSAFSLPVYAGVDDQILGTEVQQFEDGSYVITETVLHNSKVSLFASKNKTASTSYSYYNSNKEKDWSFTVTGTFSYNGTTAKATDVSSRATIYNKKWTISSHNDSKSGAKVTSTYTFKIQSKAKSATVGLKCSADGKISTI